MINLSYGKKTIGRIGTLELDARISENHTYTNEVPQYPIEYGLNITDNARNKPFRLTLTGTVSNSPIDYLQAETITAAIQKRATEAETRAAAAFAELQRLYFTREIVTVQTTIDEYPDMIIENLTIPRDNTVGQELRFTAEMVQIMTASVETAQINISAVADVNGNAPEIQDRAATEQNKGTKSPEPVKQDLLNTIADFIFKR